MWLAFAFMSAALLGFYDVCKKHALQDNAVIPILFLNTLFCSIIFLPIAFHTPFGGWAVQRYILLKACIVLSSWLLGYIGIKHLPITIVGPINATRPVMVLLGALIIFGEKLNLWQWDGTNEGVPAILEKIQPGSEQSDNGDGTVTAVPGGTLPGEIGKLFPVPAGVRVIHN